MSVLESIPSPKELFELVTPLVKRRVRNYDDRKKQPSIQKRNLQNLANSIRNGDELHELSAFHGAEAELREAAALYVEGIAKEICPGTPGNTSLGILTLLESAFDPVAERCTNIKNGVGRGNLGRNGAILSFHQMVHDAEPLPGTPHEIVQARRAFLGTREDVEREQKSRRRTKRRKKNRK